ncbi:MAG TPA: peptidoglycan-associated lipoprotein Pal [Azospirillaceae bacterium]|nr:peptidoglycan-associated lipoprotein Pal [Azospirillaceae bacterium]
MNLKVISVFAAMLALAACSSTDESANSAANTQQRTTASGPTPGTQEDLAASVGDRVFFAFDRSDLNPEARTTLDAQAGWLRRFPQARVTILGHADERGTREYNLALGDRRAARVRDYLVSQGIDRSRVETISYGKECARAMGTGEANWAQNRRAVTGVGLAPNRGAGCPVAPFL